MRRGLWIGAVLALALAGLALPPGRAAALLAGAGSPLLEEVAVGLWWFKALLLVHAALLFGLGRLRLGAGPCEPLAAERLGESEAASGEWLALAALLVVGAGLRFYDLGNGLWHDEIQTLVSYARLPVAELLTTFGSQNQHLLYSLAAHVSFSVFGESAWALRLPAAVFGIASLGALYWFGSLVAPRREALLATALATFSYHHVWFSQNARGYTSLLLWTLVGSGIFLRLVASRDAVGWRGPLAYALAMALALYTHLTAVFVVVAHGLIWLVLLVRTRARPVGLARWMPGLALLLAGTFTLQLYAPVLPQLLRVVLGPAVTAGAAAHTATEWQNPMWLVMETVRGLSQGIPGGLLVVVAGAALGAAGLVGYARSAPVTTAVMLLPAAVTAAAIIAMQHNLWPRFFFFSAGFALLILVRGVFAAATVFARGRAPRLATAAGVVAIAASATTVPGAWNPKQDYLGARRYMEGMQQPGDAVVAVGMAGLAFHQYLSLGWLEVEDESELERIEQQHERTWVLFAFPTRLSVTHPDVLERLGRSYRRVASFPGTIAEGEVVVMVRQ